MEKQTVHTHAILLAFMSIHIIYQFIRTLAFGLLPLPVTNRILTVVAGDTGIDI